MSGLDSRAGGQLTDDRRVDGPVGLKGAASEPATTATLDPAANTMFLTCDQTHPITTAARQKAYRQSQPGRNT
jgi:hypothetical protein